MGWFYTLSIPDIGVRLAGMSTRSGCGVVSKDCPERLAGESYR